MPAEIANSSGFFGRKQVISKNEKVFIDFARDFSAEIGNSSGFSGRKQVIFFARDFLAKIGNSGVFSGRKQVISKKKRSSSEKRREIRSQSIKNVNLGLDLHSSSPESVNFFGAQSSLGRAQFSLGGTSSHLEGARPRYALHGAGSDQNEGIPLKQGRQDSNFNHLRWTDENFRIGKYEGKIKFDKIWGYRNAVSPSNEHAKIQTF